MTWAAVLGGAIACYALKVAGMSVPQHWLEGERLRRVAALLPVALLAALIGTQTFSSGRFLSVDARAAGVVVAAVAVTLRAPFLVVVAAAAVTAALIRHLG